MQYDDDRDAIHFTTGVILGALIGAATALLLAPQSGRRTRRQIARTAEDWSDAAERKWHDVAGDARRIRDRARSDARRLSDRARRSAGDSGERIAEEMADRVTRGRRKLRI